MRLFLLTVMNGLTLAALYFLVASGFTLVFGLMRNVNLAHGSLFLLGAYVGYDVADLTQSWFLGVAGGFLSMARTARTMVSARAPTRRLAPPSSVSVHSVVSRRVTQGLPRRKASF